MTSMAVGGYLGGYLSHSRGVGVNNAFYQHAPGDWTAVLDEAELPEGTSARAVAGDATVLLYRSNGHPRDRQSLQPRGRTARRRRHRRDELHGDMPVASERLSP